MSPKAVLPESQLVLLLDDDVMVTEGLAAGLEREGRTIITCNDVESAQLIVERLKPSHVIADIHISGPFGYEGLDFIQYAKRFSAHTQIILISGDIPEALQMEGAERGAVAFLSKPFQISELDAMLNLMNCSPLSSAAQPAKVIRMPLLDEILVSDALNPFFQPIVNLQRGFAHSGYEALARYRADSPVRNPDVLFAYAERKKRIADLEFACLRKSLKVGRQLTFDNDLFLNVHPLAFAQAELLCDTLVETSREEGVPLARIVLELTEQAYLGGSAGIQKTIRRLHDLGVRFAFDDLGVAYSHLPMIDVIRPAFLKVSQHFGTSFEADTTKSKIVANLLSLSQDFKCALILEGIESESTAKAAADLGIQYGQGFFFGYPADASVFRRTRKTTNTEKLEPVRA